MKNSGANRRIRFTKLFLKESLIEILKKKPISQITIKEICERANINRSTFYAHYDNQYDLLKYIQTEILEEISLLFTSSNIKENNRADTIEKILSYIVENADVCKVLINKNSDITFQNQLLTIGQKPLMTELISKSFLDDETKEIISLFILNGSTSIVQEWVEKDFYKTPNEMAKIIEVLTAKSLSFTFTKR